MNAREVMFSTTWPTIEEQATVADEGCTCRLVSTGGGMGESEWEQDPYCGEHGDCRIMRATIRKAHQKIDRLRDLLENEWDSRSEPGVLESPEDTP